MGRKKVEHTAEMYACFWPSKKSAHSAKQRWGLFILQFRCKFVITLPSPGMRVTFCEARVRYPTHTHATCTIPSSRKSLSGHMFFYHQINHEEKYSAGIWARQFKSRIPLSWCSQQLKAVWNRQDGSLSYGSFLPVVLQSSQSLQSISPTSTLCS